MKATQSIALILLSALSLCGQTAADPAPPKKEEINVWSSSVGLRFSYNQINTLIGDSESPNRQSLMHAMLTWDFDVSDYLTIGLMGGYALTRMKDPVDFTTLPLSLRINQEQYAGLVFGISLKSDFTSFGDFTARIQGEFLYLLRDSQEWPIELPIETGTAQVSQNGFLATADLILQFDGLSGIMPFAGIRGNVASGQFFASETIEELTGQEKINWKQKSLFGPLAGATFEIGSSVEITLTASLLARFGADLQIRYLF